MTASMPTHRKLLLALRGSESKAESVRFHGCRVAKVVPEVKIRPPQRVGALQDVTFLTVEIAKSRT
jgi:hypothetical protein